MVFVKQPFITFRPNVYRFLILLKIKIKFVSCAAARMTVGPLVQAKTGCGNEVRPVVSLLSIYNKPLSIVIDAGFAVTCVCMCMCM